VVLVGDDGRVFEVEFGGELDSVVVDRLIRVMKVFNEAFLWMVCCSSASVVLLTILFI